jgi:hypothetical protein
MSPTRGRTETIVKRAYAGRAAHRGGGGGGGSGGGGNGRGWRALERASALVRAPLYCWQRAKAGFTWGWTALLAVLGTDPM